ncbi:GIY-YIG nuclease family protein [Haladaptatus pallidirubidus]|uniref:GIY-YIG nuclease family protein n=1 Tax=Haladaptatus pallidirubidus TaxID=1008152 RepID=A0AAV3UJ02_9EURY|nr:GIY-YIG nuclease family protein [Haladaptatus pallidirubidus]
MLNETDVIAPYWLGLEWSSWHSLNPASGDLASLPTDEGLYKISNPDHGGLVYIGETGRSLRGRVRALARGTFADEMPYRDPHTAAPCLWAIHDRDSSALEVSWTVPSQASDFQARKAIEAALIALHRREHGHSPTANFARIIPGYKQSSYRKDGLVGGRLADDETESNADLGIGPLDWEQWMNLTADDWMGLEWSEPAPLSEAATQIPNVSGVYRLWEPSCPQPLEYIGESKKLRNRLYRHRRNRDGSFLFSFAALSKLDAKHKREEVETDLLGAHWLACEAAPTDQF